MSESWDDARRAVQRTVVTPGGVVTMPVDVSKVLNSLEMIEASMEETTRILRTVDAEATDAKIAYELAYAKAVIAASTAGKNAAEREARALLAVEAEYREWMQRDRIAKGVLTGAYSLRDRLKAWQSISAMIRDAVSSNL